MLHKQSDLKRLMECGIEITAFQRKAEEGIRSSKVASVRGSHRQYCLFLRYIPSRNITADWSRAARDWKEAMNQFAILYQERFTQPRV